MPRFLIFHIKTSLLIISLSHSVLWLGQCHYSSVWWQCLEDGLDAPTVKKEPERQVHMRVEGVDEANTCFVYMCPLTKMWSLHKSFLNNLHDKFHGKNYFLFIYSNIYFSKTLQNPLGLFWWNICMSCVRGRLGRWTQDAEIKLKSLLMKSFNRKITNRNLKSQKQEAYNRDAADGSSGETGYKDTERQDITTNDATHTKGSTETYIHTQGRPGQLATGGTHEDWCRQSQTGSEERKHTRKRDYKIKQNTENMKPSTVPNHDIVRS